MAITYTNLAATGSSTNASSYATASVNPTDDTLVVACVMATNNTATSDSNTPTISGGGISAWNQIDTFQVNDGTQLSRITVFNAVDASAGSGAVTFDFAGQTQTGANWWIFELPGAETNTPETVGVGNSFTQRSQASGSSSTPSATLSTNPASTSFVFGFFGFADASSGTAFTQGTGYTLSLSAGNMGFRHTGGEYSLPAAPADGIVDGTWGSSSGWDGIAYEVAEAAAAGGGGDAAGTVRRLMLMGCGALANMARLAVPLAPKPVLLGDGPVLLEAAR